MPTKKETPSKPIKRAKRAYPTTRKEQVRFDIERMNALSAVKNSEGGSLIAEEALKSVVSTMESMASYLELSHAQLQGLAARLTERLSLYRTIMNADVNMTIALEELKEALRQEPD